MKVAAGKVIRSHADGFQRTGRVVAGISRSEELLMNGPSFETSPLCRAVTYDGRTVHVRIYRSCSCGWLLEVIDASGNLTGWIEEFATDEEALDKFYRTLLEEGIGCMVGDPLGFPC